MAWPRALVKAANHTSRTADSAHASRNAGPLRRSARKPRYCSTMPSAGSRYCKYRKLSVMPVIASPAAMRPRGTRHGSTSPTMPSPGTIPASSCSILSSKRSRSGPVIARHLPTPFAAGGAGGTAVPRPPARSVQLRRDLRGGLQIVVFPVKQQPVGRFERLDRLPEQAEPLAAQHLVLRRGRNARVFVQRRLRRAGAPAPVDRCVARDRVSQAARLPRRRSKVENRSHTRRYTSLTHSSASCASRRMPRTM